MAILQSIDYSKLGKFSNVADEISARLLSSFLEYELQVVVTDWYDFKFSIKAAERLWWISLNLLRKSVCCYFISSSSVDELRCRMFTKRNLRSDRLPPILDILVLYLRRALIFFINICFIFFLNSFSPSIKNIKYNNEKSFSIHKIPLYIKQLFPRDIKNPPNAILLKLSFITHLRYWS